MGLNISLTIFILLGILSVIYMIIVESIASKRQKQSEQLQDFAETVKKIAARHNIPASELMTMLEELSEET